MTSDIERYGFWSECPPSRYRKHTPSATLLTDVEWLKELHRSGKSEETIQMFKAMIKHKQVPELPPEYDPFGCGPCPRQVWKAGNRLRDEAVIWIYKARGTISQIANHTGVSDTTICQIKSRESYKEITRAII